MAESIATSFSITQGFPVDVFHPVYGKRSLAEYGDIRKLPGLLTDWFSSAAEADAARTQPEADAVIAHNYNMRVGEHLQAAAADPNNPQPAELDMQTGNVVRDSNAAQEASDRIAMITVPGPDPIAPGPTVPPLVSPRPQVVEDAKAAAADPASLAAATSAEDVSAATREAAATEIIPEPGQKIDLAAGGTDAADDDHPAKRTRKSGGE